MTVSTSENALLISGGEILDVESGSLTRNPGLVIREGRIIDSPLPDAGEETFQQLDLGSGQVILPGLVNLHEHFTYRATYGRPRESMESPQNRQVMRAVRNAHLSLARGITTVRELGARYEINTSVRDAVADGMIVGPRTLSSGSPLSITGGHAWYLGREVDGCDGLRRAVRVLAKEGVDWIKVMASHDPVDRPDTPHLTKAQYTQEELTVIVEEAHAADVKVTAHAMGVEAIDRCLRAGVDSLEHGVYLTTDQAQQMKERGIFLVPTISSYRRTIWPEYRRGNEWSRLHEMLISHYTESTALAVAEGVPIGIGTDSIGEYVEELSILAELGMSTSQALYAATRGGSELLGLRDLGSIRSNMKADIVVVDGEPLKDLAALREIAYVVVNGVVYTPGDFRVSLTSSERVPGM